MDSEERLVQYRISASQLVSLASSTTVNIVEVASDERDGAMRAAFATRVEQLQALKTPV